METQILEQQGHQTPTKGQTPGVLQIIKRNGTIVSYDENKIKIAINKAFN